MGDRVVVSGFTSGAKNVRRWMGEAKMLHDLLAVVAARSGQNEETFVSYEELGEAQLGTVEVREISGGLVVKFTDWRPDDER